MSGLKQPGLTPSQRKKIEQRLLEIFQSVYFNNESILNAKDESDKISEKIRKFILSYSDSEQPVSEADLVLSSKEKGLQLVEEHDLVFFNEELEKGIIMRAFLIPGMKVELTEGNALEKVTEDDLQAIDHELCVSFRTENANEFVKLGNLLDIKVKLAKALMGKSQDDQEVISLIKKNDIFKSRLHSVLDSAASVISREN